MIKVSNNFFNLNIQNLNDLSYNKGSISNLFLSILINLINNQFSKNQNSSEDLTISEIFNTNLNKNLDQYSNLIEKSYENKNLNLISLYLFYIFNNNEPDSIEEKNLVSSELNKIDKINNFQFDDGKSLFIKKLIFFLLNHKEADFSQLNQIFEKAFTNFNIENITNKEGEFSQILNISGNKNYNEDGTLVKEYRDLNKIIDDKTFYVQENKENIQSNKEDFKSYVNTFQRCDQYKIKEDLNLQFKFSNKNIAQNESKEEFSEKVLNIRRNFSNFILKHNDLEVKKGEILKEELKFYNPSERKFEMEVNDFQKIFDAGLIKSDFRMENIIKVEHTKTIDFHKFPDGFLEMIKEMSLEIQPEGEKRAFIKLEPPEIGSLDLEIKVKNKNIEIIVRVEKPELLQEMKHNLHLIKTGLEESGFNLKEIQLFLSSNFNDKNLVKDFSKEERNYSQKTEVEEIKEIDEKRFKNKDLIKFYNRNGKYYYIV